MYRPNHFITTLKACSSYIVSVPETHFFISLLPPKSNRLTHKLTHRYDGREIKNSCVHVYNHVTDEV